MGEKGKIEENGVITERGGGEDSDGLRRRRPRDR